MYLISSLQLLNQYQGCLLYIILIALEDASGLQYQFFIGMERGMFVLEKEYCTFLFIVKSLGRTRVIEITRKLQILNSFLSLSIGIRVIWQGSSFLWAYFLICRNEEIEEIKKFPSTFFL